MKIFNTLFFLFVSLSLFSQTVFFNEIHYDNVGTDADEGFEIAGPVGTMLDNYQVILYNGGSDPANATEYGSVNLQGILADEVDGFGFEWFDYSGIQNGDADGMALYNTSSGQVELYISYEGVQTASDGPAAGMTSQDIGIAQSSADVGTSLQLIGVGSTYADFIWSGPNPDSRSEINENQVFGFGVSPIIDLSPSEIYAFENDGNIQFTVQVTNMGVNPVSIGVNILASSTATEGMDYDLINNTIEFQAGGPSNQTGYIDIELTDDMLDEDEETIDIEIFSYSAPIVNSTAQLVILDDDEMYIPPTINDYEIGFVSTENADGIADSLDVLCRLTGVVHGVNLNDNGVLFTIIDQTGGIGVYNGGNDFGYTVTEGDEVQITGTIGQFNGLTQIEADTIVFVSGGNPTVEPTIVQTLDEATESQLVTIMAGVFEDTDQWQTDGSSFNVQFLTNESSIDTFIMRIDNNIDVMNVDLSQYDETQDCFVGVMITGLGGQYDTSDPRTSGYQILPRSGDDLEVLLCLGEDDLSFDNLMINQNSIDFNNIPDFKFYRIFDLNGKELMSGSSFVANISAINQGVYILKYETQNGEWASHKFIKQ